MATQKASVSLVRAWRDRLILVALLSASFGGTWHAIRPDRSMEDTHPEATIHMDLARDEGHSVSLVTGDAQHGAPEQPLADTALLDELPPEAPALAPAPFDESPFYE